MLRQWAVALLNAASDTVVSRVTCHGGQFYTSFGVRRMTVSLASFIQRARRFQQLLGKWPRRHHKKETRWQFCRPAGVAVGAV